MRKFLALAAMAAVIAQPVNPKFSRSAIGGRTYPPAPRLSAQFAIAPAAVLPAAAKSEPELIDAVRQWNAERRTPAKNGFVRRIGEPKDIVQSRFKSGQPTWCNPTEKNGKLVWYTASIGAEPHIIDVVLERVREAQRAGTGKRVDG